jgi:hypothetical protein
MLRYLVPLFIGSFLIAGCSNPETSTEVAPESSVVVETADVEPAATPTQENDQGGAPEALDVTVLAWEDLMPEGEDERLEELYAEFYEEFEARMMQQQSTLSSTLDMDQDMSLSLIAEGSDMDTMEQIGTFNVVEDLDGMKVRLPGYIVPLDFSASAEHREFLLVPYFGACLHSPPPPPNQIVFVTANPPASIPDVYDPVWLEGTLTTGQFDSELGNSAYELSLSLIEPYEY